MRGEAGVACAALAIEREDGGRPQPACHLHEHTRLRGIALHLPERAVVGQRHGVHARRAGERLHALQPSQAAIHSAQVQAVLRPDHLLQHDVRLRHQFARRRDVGLARRSEQDASARVALGRQQVERIAGDHEVGDLVGEVGHGLPVRPGGDRIGQRRHEQAPFGAHVGQHEHRAVAAPGHHDAGHLDAVIGHRRIEPAGHQHRVGRRIGAQAMEAQLRIEIAIRRAHGAGELVVEEAGGVGQPARAGVFRVGDALGQLHAGVDVQHVQRGVFAAVAGEPVDQHAAVRRRRPPVERDVVARGIERRRIDQQAVVTAARIALAQEELEVVRAYRTLLVEQAAAHAPEFTGGRRIAAEFLDARQQRGTAGQRLQHGTGVCALARHVGKPVRILGVLHPAIAIDQRLAEIGVAHGFDPRHGRGRYVGRGSGGRSVGAGSAGRAKRERCRQEKRGERLHR